ncbi:hypothetical protein ACLOAU_07920 [Niabella sp. CJ426]
MKKGMTGIIPFCSPDKNPRLLTQSGRELVSKVSKNFIFSSKSSG